MIGRLLRVSEHLTRGLLHVAGFRSVYTETAHGRIHAYVADGTGTGPPVLLVHGIAANAGHWGVLLPRLRRLSSRVIAVDLLGHGFSDAPADLSPETMFGALGDAVEQLIREPVIVIGNSLGGAMSLALAQVRPQWVRRLLLLSPAGAAMDDVTFASLRARLSMPDVDVARDFVQRLYARTPWYGRALAHFVHASFHRPGLQHLVSALRPEVFQTPETLANVTVPTDVLWGGRDGVLPKENLDFLKEHLPGARFEEPPELGHCPQLEHPGVTLRWIREHLA